jgi:hypothetical protein
VSDLYISPERQVVMREASRVLGNQQMQLIGEHLPYIDDPSSIPERATTGTPPVEYNEQWYGPALAWMIITYRDAALAVDIKLDYAGVFEEFALSNNERVAIRSAKRNNASNLVTPGFLLMVQTAQVIPYVAEREGRDDWAEMFDSSLGLAKQLASRHTVEHLFVRSYMEDKQQPTRNVLDAARVRTGANSGIKTINSFDQLAEIARQVRLEKAADLLNLGPGKCPAISVRLPGYDASVFDAFWGLFGYIARERIYPHVVVDPEHVRPEVPPLGEAEIADEYSRTIPRLMSEIAMMEASIH